MARDKLNEANGLFHPEEAAPAGHQNPSAKKPTKHYHGHRERLRDKVLNGAGDTLPDYELLELLLCAFIPRRDVKPIAKALIDRFGSLSGVMSAPVRRLVEVEGVGDTTAIYIQATHAINQRCVREEVAAKSVISSWSALLNYVRLALQHEKEEQFRILFLDRKNQLITDEIMSRGTIDQAPVYPREVAKRALETSAASIILVHNHPSGDPTPSKADVTITREIIDALDALDIEVHEHLIVGSKGIVSMKAQNLI